MRDVPARKGRPPASGRVYMFSAKGGPPVPYSTCRGAYPWRSSRPPGWKRVAERGEDAARAQTGPRNWMKIAAITSQGCDQSQSSIRRDVEIDSTPASAASVARLGNGVRAGVEGRHPVAEAARGGRNCAPRHRRRRARGIRPGGCGPPHASGTPRALAEQVIRRWRSGASHFMASVSRCFRALDRSAG
jgi:hypothetical protein